MFRKIILVIATFALVCVAFAIYVWREDTALRSRTRPQPVPRQPLATRPAAASRPADQQPTFAYQWAKIPPGQAPKIRVYDPRTGEARIIFQATQWDPISDTEFHLKKPSARVLLPGGQLAYVRADQGQVKVDTSDTRNPNPKSGWFKGNVEIFIDRTRPEWRQQHPDLAAPEQHPEAIVKIWLEDAHFDLDLARLESQGSVLVQSSQGSLEGRGLELIWSEVDRRLHKLRIQEGKRAVIRGVGLGEGGSLAGGNARTPEEAEPTGLFAPIIGLAGPEAAQGGEPPPATPPAGGESAAAPTSQPAEATRQDQIAFLDQQPARAKENRVDTYHLVFRDNVEARQVQGLKVAGAIKASVLTLLSDVGREERASVEYTPGMSASGSRRAGLTTAPATRGSEDNRRKRRDQAANDQSAIELAWTGEVLVEPVPPPSTQQEEPSGGNKRRFHLRAEGSPVEMVDAQQGRVTCRTFEYHLESKQGWLTGTPQDPVVLNAGPDRRVFVEQELFFDQTAGIARINGPGRMIGRKGELDLGGATGRSATPSPSGNLTDESADVQVAWKGSGQIAFERMAPSKRASSSKGPADKPAVYLKEAEFTGDVQADTTGQAICSDRIHVTFLPPPAKPSGPAQPKAATPLVAGELVGGAAADHITATNHVRMSQRTMRGLGQEKREIADLVTCDRLEIEMALDTGGRSYPRLGQAFGHVLARQVVQPYLGASRMGPPMVRGIRADDEITIELASVPKPVTEAEVETLKAYASQRGLTPESPQWQDKEKALRNRRELVRKRLVAHGNVSAHDTQQDLKNLLGQSLECTFDNDQRIGKALLVGGPDSPARIEHGDFDIRGQRLSLDMTTETVEVPGKGLLRFYSDQDIDGRRVDQKIPVVVAWERQMWLRGNENTGSFEGNVRVTSENNLMEARELRLKFTAVSTQPAARAPAAPPARQWVVSRLMDAFRPEKPRREQGPLGPQRNRRLARADAFGDVVIVSSSYRPADDTPAYRLALEVRDRMPAFLRPAATQPVEPDKRRLLSRIRLTGPQVRIDLLESQLLVEGEGKLLVEDYRIPPASGPRRESSATVLSASLVPGMDNLGPSQTLFTWENAMTFLSRQNLATFDRNVTMRHRAGAEMVLLGQLESALKLDEVTRRRLTSRTASLTCDNLLAQFETVRSQDNQAGPSPLSRATGLKAFWARRNVELVDREAKVQRSARGSLIYYDGQSGDAKITGSEQQPAVMEAVNPATGQLLVNWRGQEVTWNLKNGEVRTQRSVILAPGR